MTAAETDEKIDKAIADLTLLRDDATEDGLGVQAMWLDNAINQLRRTRFHERELFARAEAAEAKVHRALSLAADLWRLGDAETRRRSYAQGVAYLHSASRIRDAVTDDDTEPTAPPAPTEERPAAEGGGV